MTQAFLVFVGGGLGAMLRYFVGLGAVRMWGASFPYGTFLINISGSFLMGVAAALFSKLIANALSENWAPMARLFLTTGILGGYTTFSAFSLDAMMLWEEGRMGAAAFYVFGSVGLSILALFLGLSVVRAVS